MSFVRASHSLNNLTEGALSRRWWSALRFCEFIIRNRNRPRKAQSKFSAECICFPPAEPPFFGFPLEEQIAAKARCPVHGDRFAPTFHIYVPKWRRETRRSSAGGSKRKMAHSLPSFGRKWAALQCATCKDCSAVPGDSCRSKARIPDCSRSRSRMDNRRSC